jgi:multidrug efflux pump
MNNMKFTDIFIQRPVLATVLSLLILVVGIRAAFTLNVMEYPFTENAVVTITTNYVGADPEIIAGFITTPLENAIAQANGIDYMTSQSLLGTSTIQVYLRLNFDSNAALSQINSQITSVLNQLPANTQPPAVTVAIGQTIDSMYIGFYSDILPRTNISDYLIRVVQPKLQAVPGVQQAQILGIRQFALRAWLDPDKLSAYGLTANDVHAALAANDVISAAGRTDGQMIAVNLKVDTNLTSVDEFKKLVIKYQNGALVRLSDVATVSLGAQSYNYSVSFDSNDAVYIGILATPTANVLDVVKGIRTEFAAIQKDLPEGLNAHIVYDASAFINAAIYDVVKSLLEALIIVTLVVFLFIGSLRSVSIPVIAIPLSLIGTFMIMLALGYTINLLTLLALVLAIGLVVDDAIIVVENVNRHIDEGMSPYQAAIQSARELASPIIAISVVLIAVYLPIGFMGGLTGALFTEFAFTLAGAVGISAIVALTLSPMMCAKILKSSDKSRLAEFIDRNFEKLHDRYHKALDNSLNYLLVTAVFGAIILCSLYFLYATAKSELAPPEDQGIILAQMTTAPNASIYQTQLYSNEFYKKGASFPETGVVFRLDGATGLNTSLGGLVLKPWDERTHTADQLMPMVQQQLNQISGAKVAVFQPAPLPGTSGLPVQFVIETTEPYEKLNAIAETFMDKANASGKFAYLDKDLKLDQLQASIEIDRDKTAELGLTLDDIGNSLSAALSQNYVNYFDMDGRSYQVIPQMIRNERLNYDQVLDYYINANGVSVPLSTVAKIKTQVVPESINHFQQLNSTTIIGVPYPGVTLATALIALEEIAKEILPQGYNIDYAGESRQYVQESSALVMTFAFALIIIFLCLSALFESFRDPLIVLISVPMSIFGALIFINLGFGGASLNIYTEVGLVTLIGLISKHGILIVQFANDLQVEGKSKRDAIIMAAGIRLRPILMTTAAMVLGVIPLILATGAGAAARFNIGLVIASGISIGTLFTLFVVPAMYMYLAKVHHREDNPEDSLPSEPSV